MARALVALFGLVWVLGATAQTAVSGAITGDTRWSLAGSPYLLSGDVSLQNAAVLRIDPGVLVYMASGAGLTVHSGAILALGTAQNPIRVLSDKTRVGQTAAPGDWGQWVFGAAAVNTRLAHVAFEHGRGLLVNGSAPVFEHLDIRNQLGAAISIDLAASPTGVGLQASGNTLNAIAVPAGEIGGTVQWGLRGIPYVLGAGVISVGAAPRIDSVDPVVVEQGQTVGLTVRGSRLAGLQEASLDRSGVELTIFPGATDSQAALQLRATASAQTGPAQLRLQVDAGQVLAPGAITVSAPMPFVAALDPATVLAGAGPQAIRVTGRNFVSGCEVLVNSAAIATRFVSASELLATLPNQTEIGTLQLQVRSPAASGSAQALLSAQLALSVQAPVPPTLLVEPTPIALPPDNRAREITLRLSKADYRDNQLSLAIADTAKAEVSAASITIPAGQTSARIAITSKAAGSTSLRISSQTLASLSVPLFITADFRAANTAIAAPVGVVLPTAAAAATKTITVSHPTVGVALGAVLTAASPAAWSVASNTTLTVHGHGIPGSAQLELVPNSGVTVTAVSVNAQGTQLTAHIQTAADALPGVRKLLVKDSAGRAIEFANAANSVLRIVTGLPLMQSMAPFVALRGSTVDLLIRGRHLQQGQVQVLPADGVQVDTQAQVNADGTSLTVRLVIAADAAVGPRTVVVTTPAGATGSSATSVNTFTIASSLQHAAGGIASLPVGVRVGSAAIADSTAARFQASPVVGVLRGAGVTGVEPAVAIIGSDVVLTLRGVGLTGISGAGLHPTADVTVVGAPTAGADGTQAQLRLRIAATAVLGLRSLRLQAGEQALDFVRPQLSAFMITAPVPQLISVTPQVLVAGAAASTLDLRGSNFVNITGVRIDPPQGLTVTGPFDVSDNGSRLRFTVQAAADAASGARTVVVASAAGESGSAPAPGNLLQVSSRAGPSYLDMQSAPVGVVFGTAPVGASPDRWLSSPAVGLVLGDTAAASNLASTAASPTVGLLVGAGARSMSPAGWLRGTSGQIVIEGQALEGVTGASVEPDTGLLLGAPVATANGTRLSLALAVAPDAPMTARKLRLLRASGGDLLFTDSAMGRFAIGQMPEITSIAPIVVEQGKATELTLRGSRFAGVTGVVFEPPGGLRAATAATAGQDELGEFLKLTLLVDPDAATGQRVLRLLVPGGITPAAAQASNSLTVVVPQ